MPGIAVMSTPDLELERSIDYLRKEWGRKEGRKETRKAVSRGRRTRTRD